MVALVLLRHGQSVWNAENRFTGWADVELSDRGREEAKRSGALLAESNIDFAHGFVSTLKRAVSTLNIVLEETDRLWIPVSKDWRLNERHYGDLTGLNKADTAKRFGDERVRLWRRSFDVLPPPITEGNAFNPNHDRQYQNANDSLPFSESLKTTSDRVIPYYENNIAPLLKKKESVIISAHGNSLRALIKVLFRVSPDEIMSIEVPTGNPRVIKMNDQLHVQSSIYLDAKRASPLP